MPKNNGFLESNRLVESTDSVQKSSIGFISSEQLPSIIQEFNTENGVPRPSILKKINSFGISLFKYRILALDEVRLVQRNGMPELAGYSGNYQRRKKVWTFWKPWTWFRLFRDDSFTIGIYKIADINARGYIGYGDRHLISVNQGEYAKVIIDGKPILLDEGVHVIKTNNFHYSGKVKKSLSFIEHENLYRIQVPNAKIAAILLDNQPYLLEVGIYFLRSNNFTLLKKQVGDQIRLFCDSTDPVIQCGSLLRLMPLANTVAVYYHNGEQKIFPEINNEKNTRELLINDPNVKFAIFLSTNLNNRHYPSASSSAQFEYYTKDSVKVGVRLFVAYRLANPALALQKLDPTEIDKHIEYVTHVDMAVAGQKTSLQGIQSSDDLRANSSGLNRNDNGAPTAPPAYNQVFISVWQDLVKAELTNHLKEYGIELIRLNIEEITILNKEVEKKISEQSYRVAEASANLAAVEMERQVAEQKAQTESTVAQIKANQEAKIKLIHVETQNKVAELEKQVRLTAATAEAEARVIGARAEKESQTLEGEVLTDNPKVLQLKLAMIMANALKPTDKIISLDEKTSKSIGLMPYIGLFNSGNYSMEIPKNTNFNSNKPPHANSLDSLSI
jgi:regulator of protease activity HflC (stomatin/prohibitin superfamily)